MRRFCLSSLILLLAFLEGCKSSPIQGTAGARQETAVVSEPVQEPENPIQEDRVSLPAEPEVSPPETEFPVSAFEEIWAYLLSGSEETLKAEYPLSDVGYFGAELDSYGKLVNVPDPQKVSFYQGRLHLVVACNGKALTHFALTEGRPERERLIADLLEAAGPFDGLQIDFETVPPRDGEAFISFLRDLRGGLKNKRFTIALPARTRTLRDDVYDYKTISGLVDRVLVMAYDEHWSTSAPGPIASMDWCRNVASYSLEAIGQEKLIMGLPFYGRTWGNINPNRAFFHSGIERIKREQGVPDIRREDGIPTFDYQTTLTVTVFYEDIHSLSARLKMYRSMGIKAVGFWCLGQETQEIWSALELSPQVRGN